MLDLKIIDKARVFAINASEEAQPHISKFHVGACIVDSKDRFWRGCNIEFDNFSNTLHAEEVAIGNMIINGGREPELIVVYTETMDFPCGMCRQSLFELNPDMVVVACDREKYKIANISDLLINGFKLEQKMR